MTKKYAVEGLNGYPNELAHKLDEALEQNVELVKALEDTQKLLDIIYADDIITGEELYEVYEKNKQALALMEKEE